METYLYLLLTPESLVASMLKPVDFGRYLTTRTEKRTHDHAIYIDLKKDFSHEYFDLSNLDTCCRPHSDGSPKHTVYRSIYRVLEHVPPEAFNSMWLATKDGRELELKPREGHPEATGKFHLYQELCPVHPLIASMFDPEEFSKFITDPELPVHVPRICFMELELGPLAEDPISTEAHDLPYSHMNHLRDCLWKLAWEEDRHTVTVNRIQPLNIPFRCIKGGFYFGDQRRSLHYPFPSIEDLDTQFHEWWRSANVYAY
jgi:hypothetical protein